LVQRTGRRKLTVQDPLPDLNIDGVCLALKGEWVHSRELMAGRVGGVHYKI
jgi:hypothetical protein